MENTTRSFEELNALVIEWAREKGILEKATPMAQGLKTLEEVTEMLNAIKDNNLEELSDAISDTTVTLIIQAEMNGIDFVKSLSNVYDIISKRKGKMANGVFVKES